jgi:8-oxo-dGTP pyrophosphatase MutT (NUDIX family)
MSDKIRSAGFMVSSGFNYLLCHPTDHKKWSISKGCIDVGETPLITAIRELKEETGIDVGNHHVEIKYLGQYEMPHKIVDVYMLINDDMSIRDDVKLHCDSKFVCEKTGEIKPEMDDFKWVKFDELYDQLMVSQQCLVEMMKDCPH